MDPVQKAVINHTFGIPLVKTKRPVISCNVCQIRFNSEVQNYKMNSTHYYITTQYFSASISPNVSVSHVVLNVLHSSVYAHKTITSNTFSLGMYIADLSFLFGLWRHSLDTEDVAHLFELCFGSCDPVGI